MTNGDSQLRADESTSHGGVDIPKNDCHRWTLRNDTVFIALHDRSGLFSMRGRPNFKVHMFMRYLKNIKKLLGHAAIIMLTCMHKTILQCLLTLQFSEQWSDLNQIRSCANDQVKKIGLGY
jgi:hypothetical protein